MKKFVFKTAGYILSLFLAVCLVNEIYVQKDARSNRFLNVPDNIQICNLGSSHGMYAYNYRQTEDRYTCFNFALVSQSLSYDSRILEAFRNRICKGGVVLIDISYFSPYGLPETEDDSFESKNQRYYAFLPPDKIKNYNIKSEILAGRFRSLSAGPLQIASTILKPSSDDSDKEAYEQRTADMIDVRENARAAYKRHCVDGKTDSSENLIKNEEEITALYDIIRTCRGIGAIPVLVTTPYLSEYTDAISEGSPDFFEDFYGWIGSVTRETGVSYFDFSRDERFCKRYDWFMDADHLNTRGAEAFTEIIMKEVVSHYIF